MALNSSLIAATEHPALERALRAKLDLRAHHTTRLGALETLAVRLGLIQHSLKPTLCEPQLLIAAGDHGLAVDVVFPSTASTRELVLEILGGHTVLPILASVHGLRLALIDAGLSDLSDHHPQLIARKIAHGTRNCRLSPAMTLDQAHAAIRAGMEIADALPGNAVVCAGIGVGSPLSALLVLSLLSRMDLTPLISTSCPSTSPQRKGYSAAAFLKTAQQRHQSLHDPVEVLAAVGGFETAMLVGVMLVAASRRSVILIDGLAACAALMVAVQIAPAVKDYGVFCHSHAHPTLQAALNAMDAGHTLMLDCQFEGPDGCGATLSWPLLHSAAALLSHVGEEEEPHTLPSGVSRLDTASREWAGSLFSGLHGGHGRSRESRL